MFPEPQEYLSIAHSRLEVARSTQRQGFFADAADFACLVAINSAQALLLDEGAWIVRDPSAEFRRVFVDTDPAKWAWFGAELDAAVSCRRLLERPSPRVESLCTRALHRAGTLLPAAEAYLSNESRRTGRAQTARERQILDRVTEALHSHYGDRLSRVILFGSRARRDHFIDSDFDILVVLHGDTDDANERKVVFDLIYPIDWEYNAVVFALPVSEARYLRENSSLMNNVRKEGVAL